MLIEMQSFMLRFYRLHRAKVPSDGLSGESVFILGSDIQGWTWVSSSSNTEGWTLRPRVVDATSLSPFPCPSVSGLKWNKIIYIKKSGSSFLPRALNKRFTNGSGCCSHWPLAELPGIQFVCGEALLQNLQFFLFLVLFSQEDASGIIRSWPIFWLRNVRNVIL